ncbi:MAG: hypothetical protein KDD25_05755 [Bdellovibrionales bacterium]|nr:hypothetical protein [Bdellovibrionales bacterium]
MNRNIWRNLYFVVFLFFVAEVQAEVKPVVTGWHKVLVNGQHSGYLLQDYSVNTKTKQFVATNFTRIVLPGRDISRSLKAFADDKFHPISYQYIEQTNTSVRTINATFDKNVMTATVVNDGKALEPQQLKLPENTIQAIFLYLLMVTRKEGVKVGDHFAYNAMAEDTGAFHVGTADIVEMAKVEGLDAFKIVNSFNDAKTIEHITPTGQIVQTKDMESGVETRLVATQDEATGAFPVPRDALKTLFGRVPTASFPRPGEKDNVEPVTNDLPKGLSVPPGKTKTK